MKDKAKKTSEVKKKLLDLFGFTDESGIDAGNQLKVIEFMKWFESQPSPTVTDEEIAKILSEGNQCWISDDVPMEDEYSHIAWADAVKAMKKLQSRLSQPVRECKYVWFVENENNEWLVNKKTFTNNPLEAAQFSSEEEAVEYIIHSELHDCKPTQHELVSQPVKAYCTCNFTMINRDQETQIPFCFECKKEINESQPVTGYSEEEVLDLVKWLRENASRNNAGKWGYFGNKYCDKTDEEMFELFQSLKSKPNNGSNEGATQQSDAVEFAEWIMTSNDNWCYDDNHPDESDTSGMWCRLRDRKYVTTQELYKKFKEDGR